MLSFFRRHHAPGVQMMTDMGSYLDFVMVLLLAFGFGLRSPRRYCTIGLDGLR